MLATLLAAIFHVIFGGDVRRMARFMLAAWFGFAMGQMIATTLALNILKIGSLHVGPASLCALGALFLVHLLSRAPGQER